MECHHLPAACYDSAARSETQKRMAISFHSKLLHHTATKPFHQNLLYQIEQYRAADHDLGIGQM